MTTDPLVVSDLIGYCDVLSAAPGEAVDFRVSAGGSRLEAELVRLLHPGGPQLQAEVLDASIVQAGTGVQTPIRPGSCAVVADTTTAFSTGFTVQCWIWPTRLDAPHEQGVFSRWEEQTATGFAVIVEAGGTLAFRVGGAEGTVTIRATSLLLTHTWQFVVASYDAVSETVTLYHRSAAATWTDVDETVAASCAAGVSHATVPLLIAAAGWDGRPYGFFNGKIDAPAVLGAARPGGSADPEHDADLLAAWNFGAVVSSSEVACLGPLRARAVLRNSPGRAVTGHNWSGRESNFNHAPEQYGAAHFHDDDITDAEWEKTFTVTVPSTARSGAYALRVRGDDGQCDHIPFVVGPKPTARANVLVILPVLTYLAYTNFPLDLSAQGCHPPGWSAVPVPLDDAMHRHPEYGKSLYNVHSDGSGVMYSSWLRPILTLRPDHIAGFTGGARHFSADLLIVHWLERLGIDYDVSTDYDQHFDAGLLEHYKVVLLGSHPEYPSEQILDGMQRYLRDGGRLINLGANSLYWVTSVSAEAPYTVEVRRGWAGTRPWESYPGELHHSTTGELGGHWRFRGRSANRILGVGPSSEGVGTGAYYDASDSPDTAAKRRILEDVDRIDEIGLFGQVLGTAVGDELDRVDAFLGSPPNTEVIATSRGVDAAYGVLREDQATWRGNQTYGEARADMVYLANDTGGKLFSTGSINWVSALEWNDYDNQVATISSNVLSWFLED
jgi:N,N-dimethylformamidase